MRLEVVAVGELWDGEMQGHVVDGHKLLLLKVDGKVCAYEDRCAHLGVPLSEGRLHDGVIECRAHQYRYDALTGCGVNPKNVRLRAFDVSIVDGTITVEVGSTP